MIDISSNISCFSIRTLYNRCESHDETILLVKSSIGEVRKTKCSCRPLACTVRPLLSGHLLSSQPILSGQFSKSGGWPLNRVPTIWNYMSYMEKRQRSMLQIFGITDSEYSLGLINVIRLNNALVCPNITPVSQ